MHINWREILILKMESEKYPTVRRMSHGRMNSEDEKSRQKVLISSKTLSTRNDITGLQNAALLHVHAPY